MLESSSESDILAALVKRDLVALMIRGLAVLGKRGLAALATRGLGPGRPVDEESPSALALTER